MNADSHKLRGECRCGKIQFEVTSKPMITMACHCKGCQKMTCSAFSLSSLFPSANFAITSGDPVIGGVHGGTRHFFCDHCMSWLFTRPEGLDDFVNVRATLLEDSHDFKPFIESYLDERLPWAATGAVHSFNKFPPQELFPQLLKEFAEQQ